MKTKSVLSAVLAMAVVSALLVPPGSAEAKKKSVPKVVGRDDAADWGSNAGAGDLSPIGDALGQDLLEASLELPDKKTLNFILKLNSLPPTGGIPEASRYQWHFTVDDEAFLVSGAFTEYLRGVCYPLHTDSCPPPQDPGERPFFVRQGPCTVGTGGASECRVLSVVHAEFDVPDGTITIPVELETINAKPGSKIGPGTSNFGTIFSAPALVLAFSQAPMDSMTVTKTFTIPDKKKNKNIRKKK